MFAPHSTEAARRTLLRKQQRVAQRLLERLDPSLTPHEAQSISDNIRMELTSGWQTEELPRARLTVADEREQILFYFTDVLYRVVPAFYEEIGLALEKLYGGKGGAPRVLAILYFGSWAGGEMDGNPDVHAGRPRDPSHASNRRSSTPTSTIVRSSRSGSQSAVASRSPPSHQRLSTTRRCPRRPRHHPGTL